MGPFNGPLSCHLFRLLPLSSYTATNLSLSDVLLRFFVFLSLDDCLRIAFYCRHPPVFFVPWLTSTPTHPPSFLSAGHLQSFQGRLGRAYLFNEV